MAPIASALGLAPAQQKGIPKAVLDGCPNQVDPGLAPTGVVLAVKNVLWGCQKAGLIHDEAPEGALLWLKPAELAPGVLKPPYPGPASSSSNQITTQTL